MFILAKTCSVSFADSVETLDGANVLPINNNRTIFNGIETNVDAITVVKTGLTRFFDNEGIIVTIKYNDEVDVSKSYDAVTIESVGEVVDSVRVGNMVTYKVNLDVGLPSIDTNLTINIDQTLLVDKDGEPIAFEGVPILQF